MIAHHADSTAESGERHPRIAIIGGGFAGLCAAIRFKLAGIDSFTLYEKEAQVGGAWRDNVYPGAGCDVESHLYSFSFEPNPNWNRKFSGQQEILAYIEHCVAKYGLARHIRYRSGITGVHFDDESGRWRLHIEGEAVPVEVDVVVSASGALSRPSVPSLPGIETFTGAAFHSARWDTEFALEGKRVAVIGTGASAIQFVPEIAPHVGHLAIFQRTPPWIIPKFDRHVSTFERAVLRSVPVLQKAMRALTYWRREAVAFSYITHPKCTWWLRQLAKSHLRRQVKNPQLRSKVMPDYTIGCKRVLISNDYYPALARPNVDIVSAGIDHIVADGIVTRDGQHHPCDAIVFGTGFKVNDVEPPMQISGVGGRDLGEIWTNGAQAYLGTTTRGLPNFFFVIGPNTGIGHGSMIFMIESQVAYILSCLDALKTAGARRMEVRADVEHAYNENLQKKLKRTVWMSGCRSWYLDRAGRNPAMWPDFTFKFRRLTRSARPSDYLFSK